MPDYDDKNRGAIWKNDDKKTDKHPDFKGSLDVEGVAYWVSAWKRDPEGNPRAPALRFSIQAKEAQPERAKPAPAKAAADFDDEMPF